VFVDSVFIGESLGFFLVVVVVCCR
jgi:hypothetical protein